MKSFATDSFWHAYENLPADVRRAARKQYRLWLENSQHPSLQFKPVGILWSVRITLHCRALALFENGAYHWFWIGSHQEYDRLVKRR